jgi:hypothetical protein
VVKELQQTLIFFFIVKEDFRPTNIKFIGCTTSLNFCYYIHWPDITN